MKTTSDLATDAARHDRLSEQTGDRELSRYHRGKATAIRKQLEAQGIVDTPQVERATQRFLSDLKKAGIQVSEAQVSIHPDKVRIEAR